MAMIQEQAVLTITLFAAFADGVNDDQEREQIRRITETLGPDLPDLSHLYQDVLRKRITLEEAASHISELGLRQFAYEMAVCVCNADGRLCEAERHFLFKLKSLLQLDDDKQTQRAEQQAERMMELEVSPTIDTHHQPSRAIHFDAELNSSILNYSILNAALEMLPHSWASMAIIPLQIKMVYSIGAAQGHELDRGHIKEFLTTLGVGLTSQYVEQIGRKLVGGLLSKLAGKGVGNIGSAMTGMTFSFATTYALGHIAKAYYAGGRQMSTAMLKQNFQNLLDSAKQLQNQYIPQIQQKAATLDAEQIMNIVRGKAA